MMIDRSTRRWAFDTVIDSDIDNYIGVGGSKQRSGKGGFGNAQGMGRGGDMIPLCDLIGKDLRSLF